MTSQTPAHPSHPAHASHPLATLDAQPRNSAVEWFSHSSRLVGGQPDTLYGWWPDADDAGPCIVKSLSTDLTAYAGTLLQHERAMLKRLNSLGAPVPALLGVGQSHWLVTRFAGLTVQRLGHPAGVCGIKPAELLGFAESMSVWVHLLCKLQPLADRGILVVDLYEGNVVVPLTHTTHGQLRLTDPQLIDHAHTLEAGMAMTRPVWVNHHMQRLAPELRHALAQDQAALQDHFAQHGADLPGRTELPGARQDHNRTVWANYLAPQHLQTLLDGGQLSAQAAMQFAVGRAMLHLAHQAPIAVRARLEDTLLCMTATDPGHRFASLTAAANALAALVPQLPLVSACALPCLTVADLATPQARATQDKDAADAGNQPDEKNEVITIDDVLPNATINTETPAHTNAWVYGLLAVGAAAGTALAGLLR